MPIRCSAKVILALVLLTSANVFAQAPHLQSYDCKITKLDDRTSDVRASFRLTASKQPSPFTIMIAQRDHQQIENVIFLAGDQHLSAVSLLNLGAAIHIDTLTRPAGVLYTLSYSLRSDASGFPYVSLPVPSLLPIPGNESVRLTVQLPAGEKAYGDAMPAIMWSSDTRATIVLASVPSLLLLHVQRADDISLADRVFSGGAIADIVLCVTLAVGVALYWLRSRHAATFPLESRNAK